MSYENPDRRVYMFPPYDYGGSTPRVDKIVGPKGKKAKLVDYGVQSVSETFNGNTASATIAIGNASDPDAYGEEFELDGATTANGGRTVQSTYDAQADKAEFDALMVNPYIPSDTPIYITNTDAEGAPAGQGTPYVVIDWDW